MNNTTPVGTLDLITRYANAAREPHVIPTPARTAELESERRRWHRVAQVQFNVVGLPRGLAMVA